MQTLKHIGAVAFCSALILLIATCAAIGAMVLAFNMSVRLFDRKPEVQNNQLTVTDCAIARISENSDLYSECKDSGNFYASPYEARQALDAIAEEQQGVQGK